MTTKNGWPVLSLLGFSLIIHTALFFAYWVESAPIQLADELLFANLAFETGQYSYGNYVFNWLAGLGTPLGMDVVFTAKMMNLVVFCISLGVLVWGFMPYMKNLATLPIFFWMLVPSSSVFVAMVLPEMLYYSLTFASLGFLLRSGLAINSWLFASSVLMGLSLATKPHGLGVLLTIGVVVYISTIRNKQFIGTARSITVWLFIALGLRLIIGFATDGISGLNLLASYLPGSGITGPDLTVESGQIGVEGAGVSFSEALLFSGMNYLTVGLLFYFIPALFAMWFLFRGQLQSKKDLLLSSMAVLPTAMLFASWVFGAIVSTTGDDHSDRLLLRYSEFLIPLAWVAFGLASNDLRDSKRFSLALAALPILGVVIYLFGGLNGLDIFVSDSTLLLSIAESPVLVSLAGFALTIWTLAIASTEKSNLRFYASIPVAALLSGAAIFSVIDLGGYYKNEAARYEAATEFVSENLNPAETLVVANSRVSATTFLFESKFFDSKYSLANGYSKLEDRYTYNNNHLVLIGEIYPPEEFGLVRRVGEFAIYSRAGGIVLEEFALEVNPAIETISGIGQYTPWGGWLDGSTNLQIDLKEKAEIGQTVVLSLARHPFTSVDTIRVFAAGESVETKLPGGGEVVELSLTVPEVGIDSIEIEYVGSIPLDHDYGGLERYGLAFAGVRVDG